MPPSRPSPDVTHSSVHAEGHRGATAPAAAHRGWAGLGAWARTLPFHVPALVPALAVLLANSTALAAAWYGLSRGAYAGSLCVALLDRSRFGAREDPAAQDVAWLRFRRRISLVMDNDAASFAALAWVTRGTLGGGGPAWLFPAVGVALGVVGLAVKMWATASLPAGAYYWRNFFVHEDRAHVSAAGPYRWLTDPMYSVGYLPLYGLALVTGSSWALGAAAVAQASMLFVVVPVERRVFAHR